MCAGVSVYALAVPFCKIENADRLLAKEQNVFTPVPTEHQSKLFHNGAYLWNQKQVPSQVGK